MPDFYGRLVSLMNTQAQTNLMNEQAQDYQMLGQERQLQVKQMQQRQQDEAMTRQILMDTASGNQQPQARGGQTIQGDSYLEGLNTQLSREQQQAQNLRQTAQALQGRVSLDYSEKLRKDADVSEQKALNTEKELRLYQRDMLKQVGSLAGAANDDDSFRQAYQGIAQLNPMLARSLNVDRDDNGIPYFGPKSQNAMRTLSQSAMTPAEQIDRSVKVKDELRKERAEARQQEDEKRKQQVSDADVALKRVQATATGALADERVTRTAEIKAKGERLDKVATTGATAEMKKKALASIQAQDQFKDAKFDESKDAFAGDVADRANRIRADAAKSGEGDIGLDEARSRAIDELAPNVVKAKKGEHDLPFIGKFGGDEVYTYRRGAEAKSKDSGAADNGASPQLLSFMQAMSKRGVEAGTPTGAPMALPEGKPDASKMKKGIVYQTSRGLAVWDGTKFVQ